MHRGAADVASADGAVRHTARLRWYTGASGLPSASISDGAIHPLPKTPDHADSFRATKLDVHLDEHYRDGA